MGKKSKKKTKRKTWQEKMDYLNDKSLHIKRVSRDVFKDADIGMRRHKDKTKYSRKKKHKKRLDKDG
tara:strand:- start:6334 stop:6534 length:201 start_codon:yes stop_codon:yes gene_type:complete